MANNLRPSVSGAHICRQCARWLKQQSRRMATAADPDVYDVTVVGGGPAGLSLLAALRMCHCERHICLADKLKGTAKSTAHLRTALIETQSLDAIERWSLPGGQYSNRASSLTSASRKYLESIGAWSELDQTRLSPYHHMTVWDGLSPSGRIAFEAQPRSEPMAYMTENQNLTRALVRRLKVLPPISIFDKTTVAGIELGRPPDPTSESLNLSSYPHVTLYTHQTIASRLLIGADGINGPVRRFAGISTKGWDYERHGVVATLKLRPAQDPSDIAIAYQRFLPTGPIALLPLPDDFATLVWTTTPERAAKLKSLGQEDFIAMVNAAFRLSVVDLDFMSTQSSGQLSEFQWRDSVHPSASLEQQGSIPRLVEGVQEGSIASFPLRLRQADAYTAERVALIGDAAHTIHPLAGQGLNMGLSDSQALADTIQEAVANGADIGNELQCLDRYNSDTWMKNNRMLGVVDKLHWLYSSRNPLVVSARGWGLGTVNQLEPLKRLLMGQAGGV